MTAALRFDPIRLPEKCEQLRKEVRAFLAEEIAAGTFDPHKPQREDSDAPEFSRRVGARGWLGLTLPKKKGRPPGLARQDRPKKIGRHRAQFPGALWGDRGNAGRQRAAPPLLRRRPAER